MPPHRPSLPVIPQPSKIIFDPFNSSSTGHQRAEDRSSSSKEWLQTRSYKLSHQFRDVSGRGGEGRGSGGVGGCGNETNETGTNRDIRDFMNGVTKMKRKRSSEELSGGKGLADAAAAADNINNNINNNSNYLVRRERIKRNKDDNHNDDQIPKMPSTTSASTSTSTTTNNDDKKRKDIFRGLTMYLNGPTAPLVSDHKLKQIFVQYGGQSAISLARRTVTHVIIGETRAGSGGGGGGLASSKIEKEISTVAGKAVKYVTAQWVLDSVDKGIRQPEARYAPKNMSNRIGGNGQRSVRSMFI